jgi:hypothetical protein
MTVVASFVHEYGIGDGRPALLDEHLHPCDVFRDPIVAPEDDRQFLGQSQELGSVVRRLVLELRRYQDGLVHMSDN